MLVSSTVLHSPGPAQSCTIPFPGADYLLQSGYDVQQPYKCLLVELQRTCCLPPCLHLLLLSLLLLA
jgi:hypothetical protein